MFTPETEAVSGKSFRKLTKAKAALAREIDKGKTVGIPHGSKKMYRFRFLGRENPKITQWVWRLHRLLTEIDLPRKMYCSQCTDTASYGFNTTSYGTDTVSHGSWGKKGLPTLCNVLPRTLVYFAVMPPRLFSVYCLMHCTTTKTPFSELPQALCWSSIVCNTTRSAIGLLPNILWCQSLPVFQFLLPGAITMTKLASSSGCCH